MLATVLCFPDLAGYLVRRSYPPQTINRSVCKMFASRLLLKLTIRYKSGCPRESLETMGAAIVGRSSPGIVCPPRNNAIRQCRSKDGWTRDRGTTLVSQISRISLRKLAFDLANKAAKVGALRSFGFLVDEELQSTGLSEPSRKVEQLLIFLCGRAIPKIFLPGK